MTTTRQIILVINYDDDPDRPRILNLRDQCDLIEQRWTQFLATSVDVTIAYDAILPREIKS